MLVNEINMVINVIANVEVINCLDGLLVIKGILDVLIK